MSNAILLCRMPAMERCENKREALEGGSGIRYDQ